MSYEARFLTEKEQTDYYGYPNMYDFRSALGIFIDKNLVRVYSDGGEPEDNSFGRDWSWVPAALEEAYQKGLVDFLDQNKEKEENKP